LLRGTIYSKQFEHKVKFQNINAASR
jgi:hypothetical protein